MNFLGNVEKDLTDNFFNTDEFGEVVVLVRGGVRHELAGLFDMQSLDGESMGMELEAISHRPRLFVRSADLPNQKPIKGDIFEILENHLHDSGTYKAVDFVFEKDGTVVYKLKESRGTN